MGMRKSARSIGSAESRLAVRCIQLAVVVIALLVPAGQKWRFISVLCFIAVLFVISIVMALAKRGKEGKPRKPAGTIAACAACVLTIGILSIPAFVFTGYAGLPTSGEYRAGPKHIQFDTTGLVSCLHPHQSGPSRSPPLAMNSMRLRCYARL